MRAMILIALVASLVSQAPKGPATPPEPAADESVPDRAQVKLATDGKQHYFAWWFKEPEKGGIPEGVAWSADGKSFYRLQTYSGSAEGSKSFGVLYWEPRLTGNSGFEMKDGKFEATCGEKKIAFSPVAPDQTKTVLAGATFRKMRWTRKPYALSRDEKGQYYFVDHYRDPDDRSSRKDYRLFVGPRGQLKEQKMTNVVSDSEGDIFATKTGDFRLVLNKEKQKVSKWVSSGKETQLTIVPVDDNVQVIYNDLGVYDRAKLGTACDEF